MKRVLLDTNIIIDIAKLKGIKVLTPLEFLEEI